MLIGDHLRLCHFIPWKCPNDPAIAANIGKQRADSPLKLMPQQWRARQHCAPAPTRRLIAPSRSREVLPAARTLKLFAPGFLAPILVTSARTRRALRP